LDIYQAPAVAIFEDEKQSRRIGCVCGGSLIDLLFLEACMRKLLMAAAVGAACLTPLAQAQTRNFEGFGIGLGATLTNTTTEYVQGGSLSATDNDTHALLQLQYNAAVNDVWVLGLGAILSGGDLNAGSIAHNLYKMKNTYSLYVAPGYVLNGDWMGYGKLAYLNTDLRDASGNSFNFDSGWGYGVGLQALFGKNWLW
jgi:hypothetical protein